MGSSLLIYKLKKKDLPFLRKPNGKIVRGELSPSVFPKGRKIFAVGDVCITKIPHNKIYSLFYDGKSKRRKISKKHREIIEKIQLRKISVKNVKGTISKELWLAVKKATKQRTKVFVKGEEDLAALAVFALAPLGSVVVYGIPEKGACVSIISKRNKKKAIKTIFENE